MGVKVIQQAFLLFIMMMIIQVFKNVYKTCSNFYVIEYTLYYIYIYIL